MTPDRLDELLERALRDGSIPPDASAEERAQLEPLVARAEGLKLNAARIEAEAMAAMPTARARFQRHIAAQAAPAPVPVARTPQPGMLARWLGGRTMTWAGSAAAIAVIAVVAILVLQPFAGVETASALTIDDYVQVQGVVSATSDGVVTVQSPELGDLAVTLSDTTAVTGDTGNRETSDLRPGDPVLVSGVVTARRAIAASNVAVAANRAVPTPVVERKLPILKAFRQGLEGTVSLFSLSPDGTRARVLLVTPRESILVDIDQASMDKFLAANPNAVGARVRVIEGKGLPRGIFRLEALERADSGTPSTRTATAPQFEDVRGVVTSRVANVLMVRTDRGTVPVVIQRLTSLRFGESGLTVDDVREGQVVVGHEVAVSGNLEQPGGRRVIATLIVVLPKLAP